MRHYLKMHQANPAALCVRLDLARWGGGTQPIVVEADAPTRAAIATAFGLKGIASLSGRFRLVQAGAGRVDARLDLAARVTQTCVVSLEPVEQTITERAALVLLTADAAASTGETAVIDPDAPDEIIADGTVVDLGGILVEQLALALDPYPRKPGAEPAVGGDSDAGQADHPFAALARLRRPG